MTVKLRNIHVRILIRRSVRYLLVSNGFRLLQAAVVMAVLFFMLTGSRIARIDQYGNRADIIASIFVTVATTMLLASINRRVMTAIDRRFFRETYNSRQILTALGEAIPTVSRNKQLVELVASKINDALHPENVTIFLDDEEASAFISAFSSDASNSGVALQSRPNSLVLPYRPIEQADERDDGLVNELRRSRQITTVTLTEDDFLPQKLGVERISVLSEHEKRTFGAISASLLIPIVSRGQLHGLISLGPRLSDLPYIKEDKLLLRVVANQIATFIENLKMVSRMAEEERVARELEMAADVQRHLFPADGLQNTSLEIYGTCLPARGVGGDYYDYFEIGERKTGIAIADVAGKGIAAALLMSTVQASLRCQLTSDGRSLSDVVASMNRLLRGSTGDGGYATFFLAEFDRVTRGLSYVNAGHNPPMLVRGKLVSHSKDVEPLYSPGTPWHSSDNAVTTSADLAVSLAIEPMVKRLTTGGPIIGTFLNEVYKQETINLERGDILAVYTDGVTEAMNLAEVEFSEEKLRSILVESMGLSARETAEHVIEKVLEWQGQAPQHDDITLIIVRVK